MMILTFFTFSILLGLFDFMAMIILMSCFFVCLVLSSMSFCFSTLFFFDGVSFVLVLLSTWIFLFCLFSSMGESWFSNSFLEFSIFLGVITFFLILSFSCFNLFIFYISFEFIFFVMFIFVLGWGYSPERFQASFYMMFYTLIVSLPFFFFILLMEETSLHFLTFSNLSSFWWFFLILVFFVKLPVFGVHLWLPKAHVEAPVSGSMVLAGVLLKLGGYGFLRLFFFLKHSLFFYSGYLFSVGLLGSLYSCFICIRQHDLKSLVAYSSVCHMGMALCGILSFSEVGLKGGIFMLVSHGLCSSCLFYILYLFYLRFHSRSVLLIKSNLFFVPLIGYWWFMFCVLNMGVPPSISFLSEVFILMGSGLFSIGSFFIFFMILFLSGVYSIYLFILTSHGQSATHSNPFSLTSLESLVMTGHLYPSFILVLMLPSMFW